MTDKKDRLYIVLTLASSLFIGGGIIMMMLDNLFRGLFVLGIIVILSIIANGLESDKRYIKKINANGLRVPRGRG